MTSTDRMPPSPEVAEIWRSTDAVGFLQAMIDGRLPADPHVQHTGNRLVEVPAPGRTVFSWVPGRQLANLAGAVHGGYLALVCDEAAGLAAASLGERFRPMLTLDLDVTYLRPGVVGAEHRVEGEVVHSGRTRVVSDARIIGPDDRMVATARGSLVANRAFTR